MQACVFSHRRAVVASAILGCFLFLGSFLPACADDASVPPWDKGSQGRFVTALCRDRQGDTWAATEDTGVWAASPGARRWTRFHGTNSYGEDACYALCCDGLGRVWCGGLHGLSVFSAGKWRRFTALDGPPGSRVFCLTTDPGTGDVWGGTEAGLFRYSLATNAWTTYTMRDGLPSDAIQAVAFGQSGRLFVGTQADGLAYTVRPGDYARWAAVPGPAAMPNAPAGDGLPSPLVNCLLGAADGMVYAGTTCGLALSRDGGVTWQYVRGADWRDKALGLPHGRPPADLPVGGDLLTEDYVTCLAEDAAGHLYVGHRRTDWEARDAQTGRRLALGAKSADLTALLVTGTAGPGGAVLVGGYGAGLVSAASPAGATPSPEVAGINTAGPASPGLPAPAGPPTTAALNALLKTLGRVSPEADGGRPFAVALADDWQTQGAWLGRYGRYWACLCALFHPIPLDYLWGAGWEPVDYQMEMGPDHDPGDRLRYWMHWRYTDNPNSLELPPTYLHRRVLKGYTNWAQDRRQSEVDDHGETMPMARSGPGIDVTLTVPEGLYYLSLYEFNKDGTDGSDRWRDYRVSVRPHVGLGLGDNSRFADQPEEAHGRVHNFRGGVWVRFLVRGPQSLTVRIDRNNSFNTTLPGVTLDGVDEDPAPYFGTVAHWRAREAERGRTRRSLLAETPSTHAGRFAPAATARAAVGRLFGALQEMRLTDPAWWGRYSRPFYLALLRWYAPFYDNARAHPAPLLASRFGTCAYQAGLLPQWEASQQVRGLTTARQVEKSLLWDGVTQSCSGLGYGIVSAEVAGGKPAGLSAQRTAGRDIHADAPR